MPSLTRHGSSSLEDAPLQIFSLFKLLAYPTLSGDRAGDGMEAAFLRPPARRRIIVDVGLHKCETVVQAVRNGYIVHGFEPLPEHMKNCHRSLPTGSWFDVPVESASGLPRAAVELRPDPAPRRCVNDTTLGFAYLYQAALGATWSRATWGRG